MHLTLREQKRLMTHYAGKLTKQCKARGLKLNYLKAIALITSELLEMARDGLSVTELMQKGKHILTTDDVMEGIPREFIIDDGKITLNDGKETLEITITNTADRPIQVGSHYHLFEVNKMLDFYRKLAFGYRLDIPSGTSVCFETGESKTVSIVKIGGNRVGYGLNDLVQGSFDDKSVKQKNIEKARNLGFKEI